MQGVMNYNFVDTKRSNKLGKKTEANGKYKNASSVGNPILMNKAPAEAVIAPTKGRKAKGAFSKDIYTTTGNFKPDMSTQVGKKCKLI